MKLYHLLPTKRNIKFLKPDKSGDRIYFYPSIRDCLNHQDLNPGKYYAYVYEYDCKPEDEIEIIGSSFILGFLKKVTVTYDGYVDYRALYMQPPMNPGYSGYHATLLILLDVVDSIITMMIILNMIIPGFLKEKEKIKLRRINKNGWKNHWRGNYWR